MSHPSLTFSSRLSKSPQHTAFVQHYSSVLRLSVAANKKQCSIHSLQWIDSLWIESNRFLTKVHLRAHLPRRRTHRRSWTSALRWRTSCIHVFVSISRSNYQQRMPLTWFAYVPESFLGQNVDNPAVIELLLKVMVQSNVLGHWADVPQLPPEVIYYPGLAHELRKKEWPKLFKSQDNYCLWRIKRYA